MAQNGTNPGADVDTIPPRWRLLLDHLLAGRTITAAAREVGVGRRTAQRWVKEPTFRRAQRDAERQALGDTTRQLARLSSHAVKTLGEVMVDPAVPAAVRVRAASEVLARHIQLRSATDLDDRLLELEDAIAARDHRVDGWGDER